MTNKLKIMELIKEELDDANENYPEHHSMHEAYAVLKEEFDEAKDELDRIESLIAVSWDAVKSDDIDAFNTIMHEIHRVTTLMIAESIQLGAMSVKSVISLIGGGYYEKRQNYR